MVRRARTVSAATHARLVSESAPTGPRAALMAFRAFFFRAALAIVVVGASPAAPTNALADSGGYRRPAISAPSSTSPSSGGYRRPSTSGGGYTSRSAGDTSISRMNSAQALRQFRDAQQPRRPSVASQAPPSAPWMGGGYAPRRSPNYPAAAGFVGGFAGGLGSAAFWAMLSALSGSDRAAYFRQSQSTRPISNGASRPCATLATATRLAAAGRQAARQPGDAAHGCRASSGSAIVWVVLFIAAAAFVLLWLARRRRAASARRRFRPGLVGQRGDTLPRRPDHSA